MNITYQFTYSVRPSRHLFPANIETCIALRRCQTCRGGQKLTIGAHRKGGKEKGGKLHDANGEKRWIAEGRQRQRFCTNIFSIMRFDDPSSYKSAGRWA